MALRTVLQLYRIVLQLLQLYIECAIIMTRWSQSDFAAPSHHHDAVLLIG